MASIQSQITLKDNMSAALRNITNAMDLLLSNIESVQRASGESIDYTNFDHAREAIENANRALDDMEANIQRCKDSQEETNKQMDAGAVSANNLLSKVKSLAAAFVGMKGINWVGDSLELYDTQIRAETQLQTSLANMGAESGVSDALKKRAAELQGKTIYGDETLIGGAAEFATYMTDSDAISTMMSALTNYAAGMSGGGEVVYNEMVDYATQLGKVLNGTFDGISKKGFEVTEAQKAIIENGTDMEKALVVEEIINESWEGLAEQMRSLPSGQIIAVKNSLGDIREELAAQIYPSVVSIFETIMNNSGSAQSLINGIADAVNLVLRAANSVLVAATGVYNFISSHWVVIAPMIGLIVGAMVAWKVAMTAARAMTLLHNVALTMQLAKEKQLNTVRSIGAGAIALMTGATAAEAVAKAASTGATGTATAAQIAYNIALYACPIFAVVGLLGGLAGAMGVFADETNMAADSMDGLSGSMETATTEAQKLMDNYQQAVDAISASEQSSYVAAERAKYLYQEIEELTSESYLCAEEQQNLSGALKELYDIIPGVEKSLVGQTNDIDSLTAALKRAVDEFYNLATAEAYYKAYSSKLESAISAKIELEEKQGKYELYQTITGAISSEEGLDQFTPEEISDYYKWSDGVEFNPFSEGNSYFVDPKINEDENLYTAFRNSVYLGNELSDIASGLNQTENDIQSYLDGMAEWRSLGQDFENTYENRMDTISETLSEPLNEIADNTKLTEEDLKYLRDIAERETINRFTTAEVKIDMSGMSNRIDSDMDLDGVLAVLTDGFSEALEMAAEGVHS